MSRHRFDHSVDHSDDTKAAPARWQRIEVITGVERQRKWSAEEKAEIVAESLAEGAVVSEVARRHGLSPQQLFGWRARLRDAVKGQGDRQMQRRHSCQPSWRTSRRPRLRRPCQQRRRHWAPPVWTRRRSRLSIGAEL
jgi:transposase-like protein